MSSKFLLLRNSLTDYAPKLFGYSMRYPFADIRMVRLALQVPGELKWSDGISKVILRRAMAGIVPDPVLGNPRKFPGTDLIQQSIQKEGGNIDRFLREPFQSGAIVDQEKLSYALAQYRHGVFGNRLTLAAFASLILESWLSHHI